jgi:Na+/melibiose symporter-like transporter
MSSQTAQIRGSHGVGGLFRQRDFRLFWTGETISGVGTSTAVVAIPLLAVQVLHASTFMVSALTAASSAPWLVVGLLAGAWVDRLPSRRVMITCDIIAALLYASLPVAAWLGLLTTGQLLGVAFLAGTANMFFSTAQQVFLPSIVSVGDLIEGNAKMQGSSSAATISGRSVAGLLARAMGDAAALLVNAASFLVSAACLLAIPARTSAPRSVRRTRITTDIGESIRLIWRDPYLRPMTVYPILANFAYSGITSLQVVFLVRVVGFNSLVVGVLLAAAGAGGIIGAIVARRIAAALGTARAMIVTFLSSGAAGLLIPLTSNGVGAVYFAAGLGLMLAGITITTTIGGSFRQQYCPPELLGRVTAGMRLPAYCAMPLGALLAGALGTAVTVGGALWILLTIYALSGAFLLTPAIRADKDLPTAPLEIQPSESGS